MQTMEQISDRVCSILNPMLDVSANLPQPTSYFVHNLPAVLHYTFIINFPPSLLSTLVTKSEPDPMPDKVEFSHTR
jgi:hypothetical protein